MKKIFSILTIVSLFVIFLAPLAASAETAPTGVTQCTITHDFKTDPNWAGKYGITCPASGLPCTFTDTLNTCGTCCIMNTIYTVTDWLFIGIVILVVIFILLGAYSILTAGGSPEKVNTGRSYIIYAVVGLIIALLAKLIPTIAKNFIGLGG